MNTIEMELIRAVDHAASRARPPDVPIEIQRAMQAVSLVVSSSASALSAVLQERFFQLVAAYDEWERIELDLERDRLLNPNRRFAGSRRWGRASRLQNRILSDEMLRSLYPRAKNRNVARNQLRNDVLAIFNTFARVAAKAAAEGPENLVPYLRRFSLQVEKQQRRSNAAFRLRDRKSVV